MSTKSAALRTLKPLVLTEAYQRIIGWFSAYPNSEISLTDLCLQTRTSKSIGSSTVKRLADEGVLKIKPVGRAWSILAVPGNRQFIERKISSNLMLVFQSGLVDAVRNAVPNARAIILFGSYRKGDDLPGSDIDIAAEVAGDKRLDIFELGTFPQFGYRKGVKVNLHVFSKKHIDINLFTNIANGIVLDGLLEVRP